MTRAIHDWMAEQGYEPASGDDWSRAVLIGADTAGAWISVYDSEIDAYRGDEYSPGKEVETDDQILGWIRNNSQTAYHPIGTCRMGPGPNCVVDDKLKVHGLEGLRVADASIFPTMPSGNTNAPSIMVGEKAADILKAA